MFQGNPEVARWEESRGGILPRPGAWVRLRQMWDCVVGRGISTAHCPHQPGPILNSHTQAETWRPSVPAPFIVLKGKLGPEEGGRSWSEWSRAKRSSQGVRKEGPLGRRGG